MKLFEIKGIGAELGLPSSTGSLPKVQDSTTDKLDFSGWSMEAFADAYIEGIRKMARPKNNEELMAIIRGDKFAGYRNSLEREFNVDPQQADKIVRKALFLARLNENDKMDQRRGHRAQIFNDWLDQQEIPDDYDRETLRASCLNNCADVPVNQIIDVAKETCRMYLDDRSMAVDAGIVQ